jgi:hypothetical protein
VRRDVEIAKRDAEIQLLKANSKQPSLPAAATAAFAADAATIIAASPPSQPILQQKPSIQRLSSTVDRGILLFLLSSSFLLLF